MQDIPMQPEKMLVETTPYCLHVQLFRVQSVWQTHLTVFSSSGGDTCLVISIGIIPRLVSCQPQFEESSTFSPLYSCIWWYIKSTCCRAASEVGPRASTLMGYQVWLEIFSWYLYTQSSSRIFSTLPPRRKIRFFSPAWDMSFLSDQYNEMERSSIDFEILDFSKLL